MWYFLCIQPISRGGWMDRQWQGGWQGGHVAASPWVDFIQVFLLSLLKPVSPGEANPPPSPSHLPLHPPRFSDPTPHPCPGLWVEQATKACSDNITLSPSYLIDSEVDKWFFSAEWDGRMCFLEICSHDTSLLAGKKLLKKCPVPLLGYGHVHIPSHSCLGPILIS